mgnify:CR=1 FL=1
MSNKTKCNWIAQDKNGAIYTYKEKPVIYTCYFWPSNDVNDYELVQCELEERKEEYLISLDTHNYKMVDIFIKRNWKESLINLETHDYKIVDGILIRVDKEDKQQKHQHYKKDVKHLDYIDVYRIIELYELHDPCFQHALKKILVPGARGHKDLINDINDIIDTMQRKLEMIAENEKKL